MSRRWLIADALVRTGIVADRKIYLNAFDTTPATASSKYGASTLPPRSDF